MLTLMRNEASHLTQNGATSFAAGQCCWFNALQMTFWAFYTTFILHNEKKDACVIAKETWRVYCSACRPFLSTLMCAGASI